MDTQKLYDEKMAKRVKRHLESAVGGGAAPHSEKCVDCASYENNKSCKRQDNRNAHFGDLIYEEL